MHAHARHDDLKIVLRGRVALGLADLRRGSPSEGRAELLELPLIHDDIGKLCDGRDCWYLWLEAASVAKLRLRHGVHFSHAVLAIEAAVDLMHASAGYWTEALGMARRVINVI